MKYFAIVLYNRGLGDNIMAYHFYKSLSIFCIENNKVSLVYVKSKIEKEILELFKLDNIVIKIIGYTPKLNKIINFFILFKKIFTFLNLILFSNTKYFIFLDKSEILFTRLIVYFFRSSVIIGSSDKYANFFDIKIKYNKKEHISDFLIKFLPNEVKIYKKNLNFYNLNMLKNEDYFINPYIVIAPGSGELEKHKRWPPNHYVNLIKKIINFSSLDIVLIGSYHEKYLLNYILELTTSKRIRKVITKSLIESLNIFKNAKLVISGDSGNAHLSSIVNNKMIILWGPTNRYRTAPLSKSIEFIDLNLPCAPCYDKWRTGCGNNICMQNIKPEYVFNIIEKKYIISK